MFTFQAKSVVVADVFDSTQTTNNEANFQSDTGILDLSSSVTGTNDVAPSSLATIASTCDADKIVTCIDGYDVNDLTATCFDTCDGDCCIDDEGYNACYGFTGNVCKDGSCYGLFACQDSKIPLVVNSCIGNKVCYEAGINGAGPFGGSIRNITDSCKGNDACYMLARYSGQVGNVMNSCIGVRSCASAA